MKISSLKILVLLSFASSIGCGSGPASVIAQTQPKSIEADQVSSTTLQGESANQFAEKLVGSAADEGANRLSQLLERTDEEIVDRHKEMLKSII